MYQVDKKTGTKYAFESTSYWDKDKQQPRSRRKYLGKVDPETGKIIPSRGRVSHADPELKEDLSQQLFREIKERDKTIENLSHVIEDVSSKYIILTVKFEKIRSLVEA